jgi:peptidoglycan-associated lipoprotein
VQDILFDYDQSEIRADQMPRLQGNATWLKANPNVRFTVQGHADERGSQEYNLGLGDRRANAVKEFLASQGVADSRINIVSFGEERPSCQEQTEDCYQRNRRAAFVMNQ